MVGVVTVTIRQEDGNIISLSPYTGSYNDSLLFSKDFIEGKSQEAINDYVKKMQSLDYDVHLDNSPDSYGIVFIDFKDKEIYSVQDYDAPGFLLIGEMLINSYKNNPNQLHLVDLYKNDDLFVLDHDTEDYIPMKAFLQDKNLLAVMDDLLLNNKKTGYSTLVEVNIDNFTHHVLKEWSIHNLDNLPSSYVNIMDNMLSKGMAFTPSELASWKDFALEAADLDESIPDDIEHEDYVEHLIKNVISKHNTKPSI